MILLNRTYEYQKYLEELSEPNHQDGSWALPENATPLEQTKYEICQKIIRYKQNNKLTTEEFANKIQLTKPKDRLAELLVK